MALAALGVTASSPAGAQAVPDSKIAYADGGQIWVLHGDGTRSQITDYEGPFASDPRWSPDGSRIAWLEFQGARVRAIVVADADGSDVREVVGAHMCASPPAWSPDGTTIAGSGCSVDTAGKPQLFTVPAAGGEVTAVPTPRSAYAPDFSPDGTELIFEDRPEVGSTPEGVDERDEWDLGIVGVDGSGYRRVELADGTNRPEPSSPAWSPSGAEVAYQFAASSSTCAQHLRILTLDGLATREVAMPDGSNACSVTPGRWNDDGTMLTFVYCDTGSPSTDPACHLGVAGAAPGSTAQRLATLAGAAQPGADTSPNAPDWTGVAAPSSTDQPAPPHPLPPARLSLSSATVAAGGAIEVDADGFMPHGDIEVLVFSEPRLLDTITADAAGAVVGLRVTIPADLAPGPHRLALRGRGPDGAVREVSADFTLTAPSAGGEPVLPATGSTPVLLPLSALALASGLALLRAGVVGQPCWSGPPRRQR